MPKTDCTYFCSRCCTKFDRKCNFVTHTIKRTLPSTRCKNKYTELDWSVYCKNAQAQIDYYNKHKKKKFLYNVEPTKEQVTMLANSSDQIHAIMRYHMNKEFYQPIINKFLNRKIKDGYRILTVERGHHHWEKKKYTYLIKDDIIYAPYKKNKELIKVGVVEDTYFNPADIRIMNTDGEEFWTRYKQWLLPDDPYSHDDVFVKNFYKINPYHSVVHSDEYDRVYCISDFDERMETYKIKADNTFFKPNSPDREPYGVTDIFFNITFDRNRRKFVHHENAINKLVSSCTKNRTDFQLVNSLIHQENQS